MLCWTRNSLIRTSALGVDSGACASSLKVFGRVMFSFSGLQDRRNRYTTETLHFKRWFSMRLVRGISSRIMEKYRMDASCPMIMYGCSTGWPPIHVRVSRSATKSQNKHWLRGRKVILRCLEVWRIGTIIRIRMDRTKASTPPNLFGIDRRIA